MLTKFTVDRNSLTVICRSCSLTGHTSHWTRSTTTLKKGANPQHTLDNEVSVEGRQPDETFEVPVNMIDEHLIRSWWEGYHTSAEYQLVANNCGQVVRRALTQGGLAVPASWYYEHQHELTVRCVLINTCFTPLDCLMWVKYMVDLHTNPFFRI